MRWQPLFLCPQERDWSKKRFLSLKKCNNFDYVSLDEKKCVILHDYYPAMQQ